MEAIKRHNSKIKEECSSKTKPVTPRQSSQTHPVVSDFVPSLSFKSHVDDGLNDSQVALQAGQDVKECLSIPRKAPKTKPHHQ